MKIRCVREGGGLGDVIMCLATFRGLRAKYPAARLVFFNVDSYSLLLDRCPDIDAWYHCEAPEGEDRRRRLAPLDPERYPYLLQEPGPWAKSVDLWCPAWPHEHDHPGPVMKSRVRLFAEAAGVWPWLAPDPRPKIRLAPEDHAEAVRVFESLGVDPERTIAWQPFPTCRSRRWPLERVNETVVELRRRGYHNLIFDCTAGRPDAIPEGIPVVLRKLNVVAAMLARVRLCVGPDSAFMHLCGAEGIDTPHLSLHGKTAGLVAQRPYPRGHWLQGAEVERCQAPCWHRRKRGHLPDEHCRPNGCDSLRTIGVDHVLGAVEEVLSGRHVARRVGRARSRPFPARNSAQKGSLFARNSPSVTGGAIAPEPDASQLSLLRAWEGRWLFIFDAARADVMLDVAGRGTRVRSPAGHTTAWLRKVWPVLKDRDPLWFSANPLVDWARDVKGWHSARVVPLWDHLWGRHTPEHIPGTHPIAVAGAVLDRRERGELDGEDCIVVHFMQPHLPYLAHWRPLAVGGRGRHESHGLVYWLRSLPPQDEADPAEIREAYRANCELVWDAAFYLAGRLAEPVIATADHGEFLGEGGRIGHKDRWGGAALLRDVPWIELGLSDDAAAVPDETFRTKLEALGYL